MHLELSRVPRREAVPILGGVLITHVDEAWRYRIALPFAN